jgi:hypothetical protein
MKFLSLILLLSLFSCGSRIETVSVPGPKGDTGSQGASGPKGDQGIVGPEGPMGQQGIVGPQGPVGAQGIQGQTGPIGPIGATGSAGAQGIPGANGTTVTTIKFCSDDTSTFPEYGIVIGTHIYAVYYGSAPFSNGATEAFLALIIPGHYMSTGGNGCSFIVNNDGTIS